MMDAPILTGDGGHVGKIAYECKFTVEGTDDAGGDLECNTGGLRASKRVTFEGYASEKLYDALVWVMFAFVVGREDKVAFALSLVCAVYNIWKSFRAWEG